jgi:hypothetical protein
LRGFGLSCTVPGSTYVRQALDFASEIGGCSPQTNKKPKNHCKYGGVGSIHTIQQYNVFYLRYGKTGEYTRGLVAMLLRAVARYCAIEFCGAIYGVAWYGIWQQRGIKFRGARVKNARELFAVQTVFKFVSLHSELYSVPYSHVFFIATECISIRKYWCRPSLRLSCGQTNIPHISKYLTHSMSGLVTGNNALAPGSVVPDGNVPEICSACDVQNVVQAKTRDEWVGRTLSGPIAVACAFCGHRKLCLVCTLVF